MYNLPAAFRANICTCAMPSRCVEGLVMMMGTVRAVGFGAAVTSGAVFVFAAVSPAAALHNPSPRPAAGVTLIDTGVQAGYTSNTTHYVVRGSRVVPAAGVDGFGHGTFLATLIQAMAPDSPIVDVKVADDAGDVKLKDVVTAIESTGTRILVLAYDVGSGRWCEQVDRALARSGAVALVAAGNTGRSSDVCDFSAPNVYTVGAVDRANTFADGDDATAAWSSFNAGVLPDWVSYGTNITGRIPAESFIYQQIRPGAESGPVTVTAEGTSASAAASAATLALAVQDSGGDVAAGLRAAGLLRWWPARFPCRPTLVRCRCFGHEIFCYRVRCCAGCGSSCRDFSCRGAGFRLCQTCREEGGAFRSRDRCCARPVLFETLLREHRGADVGVGGLELRVAGLFR